MNTPILNRILPGRRFSLRTRLRWPLPALLAWTAAWLVWLGLARAGMAPAFALGCAVASGTLLAWGCCMGTWRRSIAAVGFPLSALALGAVGGLNPAVWLLLLLPVLAAYPMRAWRDAPFFPTPCDALHGLAAHVGTPTRVLDAGCGLGHGLAALRSLWPRAELLGLEWSVPLAWAAAWRCRRIGAQVCRSDMWTASWSAHDLVYVFQRPESMRRVFDKASRELAAGAWLVSLEFAVPGEQPVASVQGPDRRPLWIYRPAGAAHSITAPVCR